MFPTLWNVSDSIFNVQLCIFHSWALRCNSAWMSPSSGSLLHLSALAPTKGDERVGWDGWMASPTWWTWAWVGSRSWWWTGKPGVLQSMGLQRVGHDWATELNCPHKSHQIRNLAGLLASSFSVPTCHQQVLLSFLTIVHLLLSLCITVLEFP